MGRITSFRGRSIRDGCLWIYWAGGVSYYLIYALHRRPIMIRRLALALALIAGAISLAGCGAGSIAKCAIYSNHCN
jgi:hypothetical protein